MWWCSESILVAYENNIAFGQNCTFSKRFATYMGIIILTWKLIKDLKLLPMGTLINCNLLSGYFYHNYCLYKCNNKMHIKLWLCIIALIKNCKLKCNKFNIHILCSNYLLFRMWWDKYGSYPWWRHKVFNYFWYKYDMIYKHFKNIYLWIHCSLFITRYSGAMETNRGKSGVDFITRFLKVTTNCRDVPHPPEMHPTRNAYAYSIIITYVYKYVNLRE